MSLLMPVAFLWHGGELVPVHRNLISKKHKAVTYLITEPMLRRELKWQKSSGTKKKQHKVT